MNNPLYALIKFHLFLAIGCLISCGSQSEIPTEDVQVYEPIQKSFEQAKITKSQKVGENQAIADNIHCGMEDSKGNLWFGSTDHGLFRYNGESFMHYTTENGLNNNFVWTIVEDKTGNILVGTNKGISQFNGSYFTDFSKNESFKTANICELFIDTSGILWIATQYSGIYNYDGERFSNFLLDKRPKNEFGLTMNGINDMAQDKNGKIWFTSWASASEGIMSYDGSSIKRYNEINGINDSLVHCVLENKNGMLWCGTRDNGLYMYDGSAFTHLSDPNGPGNACIYSSIEDDDGNLWFTTERKGVYQYDGQTFTNYTTEDGLINNSVFCVIKDASGNLWFGTRNVGLSLFDGNQFINYSE